MTIDRRNALVAALAALSFLVALFAATRPSYLFVLAFMPVAVALALRTVSYPVALAAVPALVIALAGSNPFPHGLVTLAYFAWTALALAVLVLSGDDRLTLRTLAGGGVVASVLLAIVLVVRMGGTGVGAAYGSTKVQIFLLQNLVLLVAGLVIGQRRGDLDVYARVSVLLAGVSGLLLLWRLSHGSAQAFFASRFSLSSEENPIQVGREAAEGVLLAAYILLSPFRPGMRAAAAAVIPAALIALLAAGSRGPVLGTLAALLVLFVVLLREPAARRRLLVAVPVAVASVVLAAQLVPGASIQRSFSFISGSGSDVSSNGRFRLWGEAWNLFTGHPLFGAGTGGFYTADGVNQYPHNLVLEVAAELGVVGLALLAAFLFFAVRALLAARASAAVSRPELAVVASLFVLAVVNAMFSADIGTNAGVWLAAGLAFGLADRAYRYGPARADG